MVSLSPFIHLDNLISTSRQILEEINPKVYVYSINERDYFDNFNDLADIPQLNYTFNGLLATGYNVLTSDNKDLIKFTFDNKLKLDFKYCDSYRQINYNPINELINELQEINCNYSVLLETLKKWRSL